MQRSQRTHSRAETTAVKRPKSKPQLKIRAGTARAAATPTVSREPLNGSPKKLVRLAEGTALEAESVDAIDVRPAGTVVSRRSLVATKRTPVRHVPLHSAVPAAPPRMDARGMQRGSGSGRRSE